MKAVAKFNLKFNNGSFIKNKEYKYEENPPYKILITTEEGTKQDLYNSEFNTFFTVEEEGR